MIGNRKRLWALFLSAALIVTQLPAVAMAENNMPEDGSIASFEPLDSGVAEQIVDVGTELSGLTLPDTVTAKVYHVTRDTAIPDDDNMEDDSSDISTATPSDGQGSMSGNHAGDSSTKDSGKTVTTVTTSTEEIPVTWESKPAYDGNMEGGYVFTADVGNYTLSSGVKPPQITVTVTARKPLPCTKTEGCILEDGHEGTCVPIAMAISPRSLSDVYIIDGVVYKETGADEATVMKPADPDPVSLTIHGTIDVTDRLTGQAKTLNVVKIVDHAFEGCKNLADVRLPDSLRAIGNDAFAGCEALELDKLPDGLVSIGSLAFSKCSKLALTALPDSLQSIGYAAFQRCKELALQSLPDGLRVIESNTFSGCEKITMTELPKGLRRIESTAFYQCSGLSLTALPDGLESIETNAFQFCTGLGRLRIPDSVTAIGNGAFNSTSSGFQAVTASDRVRTLLLLSGLTTSQIDYTGGAAAQTEWMLTDYEGSGADYLVYAEDGKNLAILRKGPDRAFTIPETVTYNGTDYTVIAIGPRAFLEHRNLTLTDGLPDTITYIGDTAFAYCYSLELSELPAGLTHIGANGFAHCSKLDLTRLPDSLQSIGGGAFMYNAKLTLSELPDSIQSISTSTFIMCENLELTRLPENLRSIGHSAFSGCKKLALTALPDSVQSIGGAAFAGCTGLRTLNLGPNIGAIGSDAFSPLDSSKNPVRDKLLPGLTLLTDSPNVQRLLAVLPSMNLDNLPRIPWDGTADAKSPSVYALSGDVTVSDSLIIEEGAALLGSGTITVPWGASLTVLGYVDQGIRIERESKPPQAATPAASPEGGAYSTAQTVTLTCATSGVTIYYTLDDSDPATSATRQTYSAPFTVPLGTTLKVYATASGYTDSAVLTAVYSKKMNNDGSIGDGSSGSGGSSSAGGGLYSAYKPQSSYTIAGERSSQAIPCSDLRQLANDRKSLTLRCDKAGMIFDPAALKAILAAVPSTASNITFAAAPADLNVFPDAAKQIGAHPAYDFTISYKDGSGNLITVPVNFPAGSAAITLSYAPVDGEVTGSLFMVYVDGKGAVTWMDKSSYNAGKVLAEVPHFSTYGVAYKTSAPEFTDISGHWGNEDIAFVAARGLLSGTESNLFSPDGTMTRGMFVTALGRLAGVNADSYKTRSFTDVKADAYYAAYVEWAAQKNIVKGTGDKLFSPDAPVTREQMAVMMANYAGQMGYSIPTPLASAAFADNDKISEWAAKEVAAMQQAGIVKGKDGNRFDPQGNATRAEGSAVLHRFVEIVIDPATATGWVKNDSGHWLYYKGGTALTGWREIDGKWYYFDENGVMAVNTKVDGYEVGPDGARK